MFSSSSKLQKRANGKMRKRWRLFQATDFESLMYPSFTFCYILGIFPYKINASAFEPSTPRYILSTVVICVSLICYLCVLYVTDVAGFTKSKGFPRVLERNCFYTFCSFVMIFTYILNGPRMRLLQTIMDISSKLPSESYQEISRLIHTKDILGTFFLLLEIWLYLKMRVHIAIKIFVIYAPLVVFQMDMLYMNCVCILKACFKRINDNLENMRKFMTEDEVYHISRMYYRQRRSLLLIELKALKKQHLMISNAVQMLNMIFSLHLLATLIINFGEITFEFYFLILFWQYNQSMINVDNYIYNTFLMVSIVYHFIKITLIVWACETGKNQALRIGTTIHDVLNNMDDNEIKNELQLFSLQILHRKNTFSAKSLVSVDATLLTAMVGNISTYLLILMQFLYMTHVCGREVANAT